jgi:hypothetical protein
MSKYMGRMHQIHFRFFDINQIFMKKLKRR